MCGKSNLSFPFLPLHLNLRRIQQNGVFFAQKRKNHFLRPIVVWELSLVLAEWFLLPFLCFFPHWSDSDVKIFVFISTAFPRCLVSSCFHVTDKGLCKDQTSDTQKKSTATFSYVICLLLLASVVLHSFNVLKEFTLNVIIRKFKQ